MRLHSQILNNLKLKENKEDWYYLCNDAEQALFKVKNECKDERAISTIERMILDLNSIRMEQYEALVEYSLVENTDVKVGDTITFYSNGYKDNGKFSNKKDILMTSKVTRVNPDGSVSCTDPQGVKSFDYISNDEILTVNGKKLNEEFWNEAGEKEYKGITISIEKGDHGNTCYIPLRNKELNFTPEPRTQFFKLKEVKDYIDNKLKENKLDESVKEDLYVDPTYKVDTRNLKLTNEGYHNNSNIIYGRLFINRKDKKGNPYSNFEVIYFCESGDFFLFKTGTDVEKLVDMLYKYGTDEEDDWILFRGDRVQGKQVYDIIDSIREKNVPKDVRDAIEGAINNAYYYEEPFPIDTVLNYDRG